jgi:DNA-binding NtrC family response regulator
MTMAITAWHVPCTLTRRASRAMNERVTQAIKVLLVEDEEQTLLAVHRYLTGLRFEVECAQELDEALALISRTRFSLVLTDLRLSGTDGVEGLEIVSHVRAVSPETKVIILTAYGTREIENEARRRGVDDFIYKTEPLAVLARLILNHLSDTLHESGA